MPHIYPTRNAALFSVRPSWSPQDRQSYVWEYQLGLVSAITSFQSRCLLMGGARNDYCKRRPAL